MRARSAPAIAAIVGAVALGLTSVPARAAVPLKPKLSGRVAPQATTRRGGKLSPRLSVLQSKLNFAAARAAAPAVFSLPASGPGSLVQEPGGRVLVQIRTSSTSSSAVAKLRTLGAQVVNVSSTYSTVTASVAPSALGAIARDVDVTYVNEVLAPITSGTARHAAGMFKSSASGCTPTVSEGDTLMNVAAARSAGNVDGSGQTIGVLSDSFNTATSVPTHAAADIATGDLPGPGNPCGYTTPVTVQSDYTGAQATDEGRAMVELAHGLAPAAHLAFATAANGEVDFASQITKLRTVNHANVIVDDSQYLDEPFYQDGPVSQAVNAASAAGAAVFSAAGNENIIVGGNNVSSYETPAYRPMGCPATVTAIEGPVDCHDFDPGPGLDNGDDITLAPGGGLGIDLQWAQPWGSPLHHDFDVFLLNSSDTVIAGSNLDQLSPGGFPEPFEFFGYTNTGASAQTVRVVIVRYSGGADRLKFVMVGSSGITNVQYNTSTGGDIVGPTIFGHNGAATDGSTAAIAYNDSSRPEDYSSRGPETLYYQPTPSTAALASPQVIAKPDFAATDDVQNVFFGDPGGGGYRFAGTSAAAPQAAAIGALLREYDPALTPAQVIATLRSSAQPVATNGTTSDVGGGYLDALAALSSVTPLPGAPQTITPVSGNGQVTLSWSPAVASPNFPVTGYVVTPTHDGVPEAPRTFNSSATSQDLTGLANGGTYTFTLTAVSANGPGPESAPSGAVVVGLTGAPTGVSALPGGHAATVAWTMPPAATFGLAVTGYVVSAYRNGAFVLQQSFNSPKTTEILGGLPIVTTYQFSVKAVDAFGVGAESGLSAPVNTGVPSAPVQLTATPGNGTARVRWLTPPANGSAITQYRIYTSLNGGAESVVLNGDVTTHTFAHLKQGGRYTFRVTAENQNGISAAAISHSIVVGAPARVVGVTATAARKAAKVHWKAPANNGKPITGYVVTPYVGGVAQTARVFHKTATGQTITGLVSGQQYTFRVAAINARGTGLQSDPSKVVTPT